MIRNSIAIAAAVALTMTLGGCSKTAASADNAKDAIKADEKAWNEQFKNNDTEALVGHYAGDAFFVAPGVKPATGSTAIRGVYASTSNDKNFHVQFASDKIDASGDLAYARGHFSETYTDPKSGKEMTDSGSYITVYKQQSDGSWKAVEDFAAADPDSTKAVEPGKPAIKAKMTSF
ncbi:MAG: YybH family protein [Sphingomicrobium sp.]